MDMQPDSRDQEVAEAGQTFELLYAPPSYGMFKSDDDVRFRFLLNAREWATGLLWCAQQEPGRAARAGITWADTSDVSEVVRLYLSQCAAEGVDASAAYEAAFADTPDALWSDEFRGTGVRLGEARLWLQRFTSSTGWAGSAPTPGRTITQGIDSTFKVFVAYYRGDVQGLHAHRKDSLLRREDGRWWRVPPEDCTLTWDRLVEVQPDLAPLYDKHGLTLLTREVVLGFAVQPH